MSGLPSPGRVLVEAQKAVTAVHKNVLRSPLGPLVGGPFLVLVTTGRRSGKRRETVLSYFRDGGTFVVIGSDGGARRHPDWYANLRSDPHATVELGARRLAVVAETAGGDERQRLWRRAVWRYPGYAAYQARTAREIPVVVLRPAR